MLLSNEKLEVVFRKVKHIKEHMKRCCLAPDRAKLSVEDLQWAISDMYDLKIEKFEVAFDGQFLHGLVERYEKRARILLRKDQVEDMMRFVSVKELCQVALDEAEDWSPAGTETLEGYGYEVALDLAGENEKRQLAERHIQSERLAEIAATELMYPFEFRAQDLADITAQKTTRKAIALHFHMPEFAVGRALGEQRMLLVQKFWAKVSD